MIDGLDMGSGGNFGHHTAKGGMFSDLAIDNAGQDRRAFWTQTNHRRGGFVAAGFYPQHGYSRGQAGVSGRAHRLRSSRLSCSRHRLSL